MISILTARLSVAAHFKGWKLIERGQLYPKSPTYLEWYLVNTMQHFGGIKFYIEGPESSFKESYRVLINNVHSIIYIK